MIAATGLPSARRLIAKEHGFSLLEVLVALIIFSIGMLGIASLQANVLRLNYGSYQRAQAIVLVYDAIDILRANPVEALNGDCNTSNGVRPGNACKAEVAIKDWLDTVDDPEDGYLTGGKGTIECSSTEKGCGVEISWDVTRQGGTVTGGGADTDPASFGIFATINP